MYSLEGLQSVCIDKSYSSYTEINNTQKYAFALNALKVLITLDLICTGHREVCCYEIW